mgnify:CR=1 FL=1
MKYQAIYRTEAGTVELHARSCKEFRWEDYGGDELFDAPHAWGAAIEAWSHDTEPEYLACNFTIFAECLMPGYEPGPPRPRQKRPTRRHVPFDPESSTDAEIVDACIGRRLKWISTISGDEETAVLYPDGPYLKSIAKGVTVETHPHLHTSITRGSNGRRSLNFIEMGGNYRSVGVETIVSVT